MVEKGDNVNMKDGYGFTALVIKTRQKKKKKKKEKKKKKKKTIFFPSSNLKYFAESVWHFLIK